MNTKEFAQSILARDKGTTSAGDKIRRFKEALTTALEFEKFYDENIDKLQSEVLYGHKPAAKAEQPTASASVP